MNALARLVAAVGRVLARVARVLEPLGLCGRTGVLGGLLAGLVLMLYAFAHEDADAVNLDEGIVVFALLAAFVYLAVVFILTAFERLTFASVALPALVNVLLVVGVTVALSLGLEIPEWSMVVGALVGALIGFLLCRLNRALMGGGR